MSQTLQYQSREPNDLFDSHELLRVSGAGPIDDPIHIYLTQMGKIPLLKPEEELGLAARVSAPAGGSGARCWPRITSSSRQSPRCGPSATANAGSTAHWKPRSPGRAGSSN